MSAPRGAHADPLATAALAHTSDRLGGLALAARNGDPGFDRVARAVPAGVGVREEPRPRVAVA